MNLILKKKKKKNQLESRIGKSGAVVISLIKELLGHGYNLYVDNWYTSQSLFEYQYEHDTFAANTAQKKQNRLAKII